MLRVSRDTVDYGIKRSCYSRMSRLLIVSRDTVDYGIKIYYHSMMSQDCSEYPGILKNKILLVMATLVEGTISEKGGRPMSVPDMHGAKP